MAKIAYIRRKFTPEAVALIKTCDKIVTEYARAGRDLTLRQLYYQLVAHDHFPDSRKWARLPTGKWVRDDNGTKNAEPNYDWLGTVMTDARMAGLIDWNTMVDRTRATSSNPFWVNPAQLIGNVAGAYHEDLWATQPHRVMCMIEKEALSGMLENTCPALDVPYLSCRGYMSMSEMWRVGQRIIRWWEDGRRTTGLAGRTALREGQPTIILHLGDHDPSGIDMTRDIADRLAIFCEHHDCPAPEVRRIALTMEQVRQYDPPPNPAKLSDSRCAAYIQEYGDESWELDAMPAEDLEALITESITELIDSEAMDEAMARMEKQRETISLVTDNWDEAVEHCEGL